MPVALNEACQFHPNLSNIVFQGFSGHVKWIVSRITHDEVTVSLMELTKRRFRKDTENRDTWGEHHRNTITRFYLILPHPYAYSCMLPGLSWMHVSNIISHDVRGGHRSQYTIALSTFPTYSTPLCLIKARPMAHHAEKHTSIELHFLMRHVLKIWP